VTFSPAPSPRSLCAAWNATSYPDLADPNVVVQGTQPTSGDDTITVTDTADCNGGFHFGSIDLGQRDYFNSSASFGGSVGGCRIVKTTECSTIHWDGQNTLTITLGKEGNVQPIQTAPSVLVYTPDPLLAFQRRSAAGGKRTSDLPGRLAGHGGVTTEAFGKEAEGIATRGCSARRPRRW